MKINVVFPCQNRYTVFMQWGMTVYWISVSLAKADKSPLAYTERYNDSVAEKLSGRFYFGRLNLCLIQREHNPRHGSLTDFLPKQKNVVQPTIVPAPVTHKTGDLSGSSSNVAEGNQNGIVSHAKIPMLKGLSLVHGENHIKQTLWNYEYPALLHRACVTLHSFT
jgi:hypothetical protein